MDGNRVSLKFLTVVSPCCRFWLVALLIAAENCLPAHAGEMLRFSVPSTWGMPIAHFSNGTFDGGLMKQVIDGIASEMGAQPQYVILPRTRINEAVKHADIDVRCYFSPLWAPDPQDYEWGPPILKLSTLLISDSDKAPVHSVAELSGQTVGTVLGYEYVMLQAAFARQAVIRDDAPNDEALFRKLSSGRDSYVLMNDISYHYLLNKYPPARPQQEHPLRMESTAVYCAVPKNGAIAAARVFRATSTYLQKHPINTAH